MLRRPNIAFPELQLQVAPSPRGYTQYFATNPHLWLVFLLWIAGLQQLPFSVSRNSLVSFASDVNFLVLIGFREFVVGPALNRISPWQQYAYRRRELGFEEGSMSSSQAVPNLRMNKLPDSGISGCITGGLLRGLVCESCIVQIFFSDFFTSVCL